MRESTETLWSLLQNLSFKQEQSGAGTGAGIRSSNWLEAAVLDCGFLPLKLSHPCLIQQDRGPLSGPQVEKLLGGVCVFGCLADGRCPTIAGSDLVRRELDLVQHGAIKTGLNALLRALSMAENVAKPVCLLLQPWPETASPVSPDSLVEAIRSFWPKDTRCGFRAAVFLLPKDPTKAPVRVEMNSLTQGERPAVEDILLLPAAAEAALEEDASNGQPVKARALLIAFEMGSAAAAKMRFRGS